MSGRVIPQEESEGWQTVAADESYVGVLVGPSEHWVDLTGDGKKQPTGRVNIQTYKQDNRGQPFEPTDSGRFSTYMNFIVLEGQYKGYKIGLGVSMKKLIVDPLGQRWTYRFQADTTWMNKLTRVLTAAGFTMEAGEITPWMAQVTEYVDGLADEFPWLFMPTPTPEQMAAAGLEGDPLPGYTRELLFMGIRHLLVERLPICVFKTRMAQSGKVRIQHDSVDRVPKGAESLYRAMLEEEEVKKAVAQATYTMRHRIIARIPNATWGMPEYETVDDLAAPLPFLPEDDETDQERTAKLVLKAHVNRLATALGETFKADAWSIIEKAFQLSGVKGRGFEDLPFPTVEATYHEIVEAALKWQTGGLPDELKLTVEQFDLLVEAGLDVMSLSVYTTEVPVAADAPPPTL